VLCKYAPYRNVEHHGFFVASNTTFEHDFPPYLMGEKKYPFMDHRKKGNILFWILAQHDTQMGSICWKMLLGF